MENRVVAFIDILGFKNALEKTELFEKIFALVSAISSFNASHSFEIERLPYGYGMGGLPEISSFSDHVVISIKDQTQDDIGSVSGLIDFVMFTVTKICDFALFKGFLVRGGMAYGEVTHNQNIVFGRALVEAIEIESTLAAYPRIILSKTLLNKIAGHGQYSYSRGGKMTRDHDGLIYSNWMACYTLNSELPDGRNLGSAFENFTERFRVYKTTIEQNLDALRGDFRKYRHWYWLAMNYNLTVENQQKNEQLAGLASLIVLPSRDKIVLPI